MAQTGYGRTSSLNRIQYYKGSNSRTYRGVKTPKMVASMSLSMQKAQDQAEKNAFNAGQISTNDYIAYLTKQIATTSDPTYRNTLTQELQTVTVTDNEKLLTQGYTDGTVSAGQVEDYYKNKLATLDPNSQAYQDAQNNVAKYTKLANQDAYKAQEAVLKEQYNGAADKLSSAQKLLDFYIQQSQTLTPGTPDYNTAVQNIGTYQAEVRKISFEQQLLKAEDSISQQYAKDTPENWSAKAQLYGQLRDAAAAQGDITNFYKYDQLANTANDNIATSQAKVVSKQINEAIKQTQADYLSGKIDAQTAQDQMQQISDAALQANDTNGVIVAHDYFNKIQNDVTHGVSYGEDNGFGKTKGGSGGDTGVYDLSTGSVLSSGAVASATKTTTAVNNAKTVANGGVIQSPTGNGTYNQGSILDQVMKAANVTNAPDSVLLELGNAYSSGATFKDMVDLLRVKKVGTGDGFKALTDVQKSTSDSLNQALHLGYDPQTGLPFTPDEFRQAMLASNTALAAQYGAWQTYIQQNPNAKINLNGTNTKISTLADNVDKILNGTTKIDPATGLVTKDTPGLLDSLQTLSNPNSDFVVVEDPKNPGQFVMANKAAYEQQNGSLAANYVQDENGIFRFVNNPNPVPHYFQTQEEANKYASDNKIPLQNGVAGQSTADGRIVVYTPNNQPRTVVTQNGQGQSITYVLDGGNKVIDVKASPGALPEGYKPSQVMSFGGAQLSVPSEKLGVKSGFGQTVSKATPNTPANFSSRFGPRYADQGNMNVSKVAPNTSTRNGSVYTPPPTGPNYSPVPANKPTFTPANESIAPVVAPLTRPVDQLIQNAFNIKSAVPASAIPANTQIQAPSQQKSNPATPSAPLSVAGQQPQNNIQQFAQTTGTKVSVSPPPSTPVPTVQQPNWLATAAGNVGKAIDNGLNAVGNFFGGFHF